jgi:uncharacterized iron-regulated membrane protein
MRTNRVRLWYRLHRWSSLICTLFLLVSCITGLPLIFHDEIDHLMHPGHSLLQTASGHASVSLQSLVKETERLHPGMHPMFVVLDEQQPTVHVTLSRTGNGDLSQRVIESYNAYTGARIDTDVPGQDFMDHVLKLHQELFADIPGELFLGVMAVVLLVSLISGAIVYGPFMRRLEFGTVRWNRSNGLPWFDVHNVLGIVTLCWMLLIAGTGLLNAISTPLFAAWRADRMAKTLTPYRDLPPVSETVSVDAVRAAAQLSLPDCKLTAIVYPHPLYSSPWHFLVYTEGRTPVTSRIFTPVLVDARTGHVTSSQQFPWYIHALEVSRPLHFGDYGGLPLKIIWAFLDIAFIAVLVSGLALWWKKRNGSQGVLDLGRDSNLNSEVSSS